MSTRDVTGILRVPGRLYISPTNLGIVAPYGGTELGAVRQVALRLRRNAFRVEAEEFDETVELIYGAMKVVGLAVNLRQALDPTAIATIFPSTSTGASTGSKVIDIPGTGAQARAGSLGSAAAVKLLFAADDAANHPSIILYSAMPAFEENEVEIMSTILSERGLPVVFIPKRDASSPPRVGKIGKLADLAV